jgi:hypothetical protein
MGDPECQTILPKLKTDLIDILIACCEEKLDDISIQWLDKKSLCVVLCSKGYPDKFLKNIEIRNLNQIKISDTNFLFHAGTVKKNNEVYAVGGRVLNFVSLSDNFSSARKKIFKTLELLNWQNGFYRKDIGYKVIDEAPLDKHSSPNDRNTRPLKDLTKESIFNIIEHTKKFNVKIEGKNILDLFSGVGSFGLECLSRGASSITLYPMSFL